jgi:hypothetical protein
MRRMAASQMVIRACPELLNIANTEQTGQRLGNGQSLGQNELLTILGRVATIFPNCYRTREASTRG